VGETARQPAGMALERRLAARVASGGVGRDLFGAQPVAGDAQMVGGERGP
jgi:hypothetical protein